MFSQKLRQDIESEKQSHLEAVSALERERLTVSSLRRELDLERDQLRNSQNKYKAKIEQLRASCEVQKARCEEINKYVSTTIIIIIIFISYIRVQQQEAVCKQNTKTIKHGVADNSTTWSSNTRLSR